MKIQFVRRSDAPVRAVPLSPGQAPPTPKRAGTAGFTGAAGEVADIPGRRRRTLLLGLGAAPDFEAAGALAVARLPLTDHLALDARALTADQAASFAAGACLRAWQFDRLRTQPDPARRRLRQLDVRVTDPAAAEAAWAPLHAAVRGVLFARDLVTEPGNVLTPQGFAARLARLEREGVHVEILDAARLEREGCGALLAVGQGSVNPPALAVLRWPGVGVRAPVVFVGKGITFDTGGVCVKPGAGMWDMRADMAGAAACAGAMLALALRRSPAPVTAVLALAENALGANSYRPGDVLRAQNGTTIEVIDTDAEGRLVLADALGWAVTNLEPRAMIDLATLTGSIVTALGHGMAGLFGTDDALRDGLVAAGRAVGEPVWPMPIGEAHKAALESDIADLRHCGTGPRQPDACIAAAFLREFVGPVPWAHLDIAGMEQRETGPWLDPDRHGAGATGFGVRLLDRLVAAHFE